MTSWTPRSVGMAVSAIVPVILAVGTVMPASGGHACRRDSPCGACGRRPGPRREQGKPQG